ncbi:MAG: glucose-6-phosphate isomerase, partial [Proteobacteria bacterium]|nr:glucose-6-phosphate isomerase [Pseudomonadota bacterium]
MPYHQNIDHCFADAIGATGLDQPSYEAALSETEASLNALRAAHKDGNLALLRLPARTSDMEAIEAVAERYIESFDDVIVLGIGGSSLGGQTLVALTGPTPTGQ